MEHVLSMGRNFKGIAMRFAHALGLSGDVTTLCTPDKPLGFSAVGVERGTTTSQRWGTFLSWPTGCSFWPHPRPGASRPVCTWNSCWPVPVPLFGYVRANGISFVVLKLKYGSSQNA